MALNTNVKIPFSKFLDETTGRPSREWLLWLMSPDLIQLNLANAVPVTSGGTGTTVVPLAGQILIGNGTSYTVNYLTAGTGLSVLNGVGTLALSLADSGVTAASYGSASTVPVMTVNVKGQVTAASNVSISINGNQITSGFVSPTRGGTGLTTYAIGDLLYCSATNVLSKLTIGSANTVLTSSGSFPQYVAQSTLSVGAATNISGGAANRIPYQTGAGATSFIVAPTTAGDGLIWNGTNFAWAAGGSGSGTVTSVSGTGTVSGLTLTGTVTTSGSLTLGGTLDLSSPPAIGATAPNTVKATTFTGAGTGLTGTAASLSIGGNAATVTNGVYTTGSYSNPSWLPSVALTTGTISSVPSNGTDIVNKSYVDLIAGSGIHIHTPVLVETPFALTATYVDGGTTPTWTTITTNREIATSSAHGLSVGAVIVFGSTTNGLTAGTPYFVYSVPTTTSITLSLTYNGAQITTLTNGTGLSITSRANSGVGATLTNSGTLVAINIDNVALSIGDRVLVYRQASAFQNGIYTVTTVGSGAVAWVLTRATDANTYSPNSTSSLGEGDYFFVQSGDTGKGESYVLTTGGTLIFGTTNLTFTQFSDSAVYSAGTGLTLSGTTFSITPVGTAGTYGSASTVPVFTTNASGQITGVTNTAIAILGSAVSGNISGNAANITGTYAGTLTSSQITTGLGFTPYNATNPAGYTTNTGTVTSVAALTLGTTGTDLSSTVATGTTTPVITLQVPTASATNRGALSAADWSTFNSKQAALGYTPVNKAGDTMTGALTSAAGTATAGTAPLYLTAGTNLTTAAAGAIEFDTANTIAYFTGNTTNGRGITPNTHYFRLAANGAATATTISPFFGANSSLPLVANGVYEIEIECYFLKNTAGTLTWTLTNSAVVTAMQANFTMSPITGVATAGAAPLMGFLINQTAAAAAFGATGSLTTAVNHWIKFKIILENASSTSIRLNVTNSAGTITPLRGSFWKATRITNAGTYAA